MNWKKLQTYGLSSEKSFEMLCNQLFENWCREEYKDSLLSFNVVNGAGGDGGVESYAVLNDNTAVGLQAKWFLTSISSTQISQIKNSVKTAKKIRPEIKRYIVCVPRDLASKTAKSDNTESKRWEDFVNSIKTEFPELVLELWDDTKITSEIQKPYAAGIHKYWFENAEIDFERFCYSFSKAKDSWLSTKYIPDLNVTGQIDRNLSRYIGDFDSRNRLAKKYKSLIDSCKKFIIAANRLILDCGDGLQDVKGLLLLTIEKVKCIQDESKRIYKWLINEFTEIGVINEEVFYDSFGLTIERIESYHISFKYHFHVIDTTKHLNAISETGFYDLLEETNDFLNRKSILFLGNPGTGKTHGVSAFVEKILEKHIHIPIIIQARNIPETSNWRDILINTLGVSYSWDEDELWQALISAANRNRFFDEYLTNEASICPKVFIVVDGIDESATIDKWIERIKETASITGKYPQIRFCFTSRPAAFPDSIDFAVTKRLSENGDAPVFKLFDSYTNAYDITAQNCPWLKFALDTPLALKLFCELYAGNNVTIENLAEVSMDQLWREKIERIQDEFNRKNNISYKNQFILKSIISLSNNFLINGQIERDKLVESIKEHAKVSDELANQILDYLESYGVVGSFCKKGTGLDPDLYIYYTGIQGYFDYASALQLLRDYNHPSEIDFEKWDKVSINTLYCLAIISIQKYGYLITHNSKIKEVEQYFNYSELQFYVLQHADFETANKYRQRSLEIMREGAATLVAFVNKLILPLSRIKGHPLGISLLNDYLNEFEKPAQRDVVWSLPSFLRRSHGKRWEKNETISLVDEYYEEFELTTEDFSDGLPVVYVWMLSNVSNPVRKTCRNKLMAWANTCPKEYFKLFLSFKDVNDPQIKSDLFSILMCLVYAGIDNDMIKEISDWVLSNVLAPSVIDRNRDVSIRYYSIGIIEKAKMLGIYSEESLKAYLPPYIQSNNDILMNKDALAGTRMGGYSAINYDLARYVLIDHFSSDFNSWHHKQLDAFLESFAKDHPDYSGINSDQFIISAAYAFVLKMGWNEEEFYNYNKDELGEFIGGADCSIRASYHSATHGSQSQVMTICEKYVWQARNYISGFLSDRLLFGENLLPVTDYNLLDDFSIPIQELYQIDPDNIPDDRPWHIPEPSSVIIDDDFDSKESISEYIENAPDINWEKWIKVNNDELLYSIHSSELLALNMYSCFYGTTGVEATLFIYSIVLPIDEVSKFVKMVHKKELFQRVCNPTDWDGGVDSSCYITPKEICWFPRKKYYDSYKTEEFPELSLHSAVDSCCYNYPEYGDVHYSMPSFKIRSLLGIVDTDGYVYYDKNNNAVSEFSISGEKWRTTQECVLVSEKELLKKLNERGLSLVWIMQELRCQTGYAREHFGEFFAERRQYYIGYFKDGEFVSEKLISGFSNNLK